MKKIALLIVFAFSITLVFSQQEIELLPDGIVIPRITNAQRPSSPSIGHLVFNTDQDQFEYFDGSSWSPINSDGAISDKIQDADNDTEISLEEGTLPTDQDFIRFSIDNQPSMVMQRLNSDAGSRIYFPGSLNSFIGFNTGLNTQSVATDNIGIGFNALRNNQTSDFNIAIGTDALKNLNTSDDASPFGGKNVSIGYKSLEQAGQTATSNVAIGYEAGSTGSGMSKSVFIGNQAGKNATSTDNTLYINNEEGDNPLIFGDFTNNRVGINYNGTQLQDAFHVEAGASQGPMRIRIGGSTKFRVHNNGGLSIGTFNAPFDDGLKVQNLAVAGDARPLFADDRGNVTRSSGEQVISIPAHMFTEDVGAPGPFGTNPYSASFSPDPVTGTIPRMIAPINLPNGVTIKRIEVLYWDENDKIDVEACFRQVELGKNYFNSHEATELICDTTTTSTSDLNTLTLITNEVVDYDSFLYDVRLNPLRIGAPVPLIDEVEVYNVKIFYEY